MTAIDVNRPTPEQYEAGRRLKLGHPWRWTVAQAVEAEQCDGQCIAQVSRGTRHVVAVAGCPAHSEEER